MTDDVLYDPDARTDWFELLKLARIDAGNMTYADIAKRAGVSYATAYNTFVGVGRPSRGYLAKIVGALAPAGSDTSNNILAAFDADTPNGIKAGGTRRSDLVLAESINKSIAELVAAVRELTAAVREGITSRQAQ